MNGPKPIHAVILLIAVTTPACDLTHRFDDTQFDDAIARLDRGISAFDGAINKITAEAGNWRTTLEKLEVDLKADTQDVLANEVHDVASSVTADAGDQLKGFVQFLEANLKANLAAMRKALEEARGEIVIAKKAKNYNGLGLALTKLSNVKVRLAPAVTTLIPSQVRLEWHDHKQDLYHVRNPIIAVRGWGFERPQGDAPVCMLAVMNETGTERAIPISALSTTTPYLMQINLETTQVDFQPGDSKLIIAFGSPEASARLEVPISHIIPKQPIVRTYDEIKSHTISYRQPRDWKVPTGGERWKEEWTCPEGWRIFEVTYDCEPDPGDKNPGGPCGHLFAERKAGWDADYTILDDGLKVVLFRRITAGGFFMKYIIRYKRTITVTESASDS